MHALCHSAESFQTTDRQIVGGEYVGVIWTRHRSIPMTSLDTLRPDEDIKFDTQEEVDYGIHAEGVPRTTGGTRRVLTTRSDGMIWFEADAFGSTSVKISK